MKKLKLEKMSPVVALWIAGVVAVAAIPIRLYQIMMCVDHETGFWILRNRSIPVLSGLILFVMITALLVSLTSGKMPKPKIWVEKQYVIAVDGAIAALGFLADAISQILKGRTLLANLAGQPLPMYLSSGAFPCCAQALFAILSTVYFLVFTQSYLTGRNEIEKHPAVALAPVLWGVSRLLVHLVEPISYRNVSQLLLELLMLGFYVIFFLSYARMSTGINAENSAWLFYFSGVSACFLAIISAVPPLFLTCTGNAAMLPDNRPMQLVDIGVAVFICCMLITTLMEYRANRGLPVGEQEV